MLSDYQFRVVDPDRGVTVTRHAGLASHTEAQARCKRLLRDHPRWAAVEAWRGDQHLFSLARDAGEVSTLWYVRRRFRGTPPSAGVSKCRSCI